MTFYFCPTDLIVAQLTFQISGWHVNASVTNDQQTCVSAASTLSSFHETLGGPETAARRGFGVAPVRCHNITICCYFLSAESIKKTIEKSSIKFIHGVKLDTKTGKSDDRILVSWNLYQRRASVQQCKQVDACIMDVLHLCC